MRKIAAVLTSITLLAACGGSSSDTAPSAPSLALADVPQALAKSFCDASARCNQFYYPVAYAVTDCGSVLAAQFQDAIFNQLTTVIADGTTSYDPVAGKACVDAVETMPCSGFDNNLPDVCRTAFQGTVDIGGDCTVAQECTPSGSRCDTSSGTCPGKCAERASAGVDCTVDDDCQLGLKCAKLTSKCSMPPAVGDACGGGVDEACASGLLCLGDDASTQTPGACVDQSAAVVGPEGAACSLKTGPLCQPGLSCVIPSITADVSGTCAKTETSGAMCSVGFPTQCTVGQYCPLTLAQSVAGMTANCTDLPVENMPCAPDIALNVCGKDLVCDASKTCVTRRALGQTCTSDAVCISAHCSGGACVPASVCAK